MLSVYRLIVEIIMLRNPCLAEDSFKFFVGFNEEGNAYLFLPTAKGLLKPNHLFAIAIIRNEEKKYIYVLDTKVVVINLEEMYEFHEDLTFFFSPNHNMLTKFLDSTAYQTYINWVNQKREKTIDHLLSQYGKAMTPYEKQQLTEQLKRFIEA